MINNYIISMKRNLKKDVCKSYPTPGEPLKRTYKIIKQIDIKKDLGQLIEENIENFKNPLNDKDFIENQILLDYIISEKYKNKELNFNKNIIGNDNYENKKKIKENNNKNGMDDLLNYYKKKKYKVYIDNSINGELYSQLQKYYFNKYSSKRKIRLHLNINKNILNDEYKLKKLNDKIIEKISYITKIHNENLFVTNIREGSLNEDIYAIDENIPENIVNDYNVELSESLRGLIEDFDNIISNEEIENIIQIRPILENYVLNLAFIFNERYNKNLGDFGLHPFMLFFEKHDSSSLKNGKRYYYPNDRFEGYGLRVHCKEIDNRHLCCDDIFNSKDWCNAYTSLEKDHFSYKISNIRREVLYNNDNQRYTLLFQCKIKISEILDEQNFNITLNNQNQNSIEKYVIPYRLLKENLPD